jgi:hypothetical protein
MPTAQQIADKVNELITMDSKCIDALLQHQTPCNTTLRNHPDVTIITYPNPDSTKYFVSCLSLLNALVTDSKCLIAEYDSNDDIIQIGVMEKSKIVA